MEALGRAEEAEDHVQVPSRPALEGRAELDLWWSSPRDPPPSGGVANKEREANIMTRPRRGRSKRNSGMRKLLLASTILCLASVPALAQVPATATRIGSIPPGYAIGGVGSNSIGVAPFAARRDLFVETTGTDTGTCQSLATACKTLDYAGKQSASLMFGNQLTQINMGTGTFDVGMFILGPLMGAVGNAPPQRSIRVSGAGHANTHLTVTDPAKWPYLAAILVSGYAVVSLGGLSISDTVTGACDMFSQQNGYVQLFNWTGTGDSDVWWGTANVCHIHTESGGQFETSVSYTIDDAGATPYHYTFGGGSYIQIDPGSYTINCTGAHAYTYFAQGDGNAQLQLGNAGFSGCGTVTGPRWSLLGGANIRSSSASFTFLPGDAPGVTNGGIYQAAGIIYDGWGSTATSQQQLRIGGVVSTTTVPGSVTWQNAGTQSATLKNITNPGVTSEVIGQNIYNGTNVNGDPIPYCTTSGIIATAVVSNEEARYRISCYRAGAPLPIADFDGNQRALNLQNSIALNMNGNVFVAPANPTISSGFGTGASISATQSTSAFVLNVGTTPGSSGVISFPTALHGWVCVGSDVTTHASGGAAYIFTQTGTSSSTCTVANYSSTAGTLLSWTNNDQLLIHAFPY